jgi:hypothetical protein
MLKILLERDHLIEQYYESKKKSTEAGNPASQMNRKIAQNKQTILESVNPNSREHTIISNLYQTKAEITVSRRVLDVDMIKMSCDFIKNEHASLQATFEQVAADEEIHAYVHPQ